MHFLNIHALKNRSLLTLLCHELPQLSLCFLIAVKKQRLRIIGPRPLNQLPPATPSPTLPQASQPASPEPANAQQADTTGIKALKIQFEEEADAATIILNQMLQRPAEPLTLLTAAEATPPASPQPADSEQTSQDWIEAMLSSFADESSQTTASDQLPPPIEKIPLVIFWLLRLILNALPQ